MDFQVETQFPEHPRCYRAVCEACGVGERTPVIQVSSVSVDHEDGIYTGLWVCHECVREWGRALGMLDVSQADMLRDEVQAAFRRLDAAEVELEKLRPVRDALEAAAVEYVERETKAALVDEQAEIAAAIKRAPAKKAVAV